MGGSGERLASCGQKIKPSLFIKKKGNTEGKRPERRDKKQEEKGATLGTTLIGRGRLRRQSKEINFVRGRVSRQKNSGWDA